jgi:hypothetical protein
VRPGRGSVNALRVGVALCLVVVGLSMTPCYALAAGEAESPIVLAADEPAPLPLGRSEAPAGAACGDSCPCPCLCSVACPGGLPAGGAALLLPTSARVHVLRQVPALHSSLLSYRIFHPPRFASIH